MKRKGRAMTQEDDGRTIVDMNVEGMTWYVKKPDDFDAVKSSGEHRRMTREEQRMYTWAAVKAGLLVVLVFAVVFALFIAFCDFVWFR